MKIPVYIEYISENAYFMQFYVIINSSSVPKNKRMSMTFKTFYQDVHSKQANLKSFQTKRQHCCDPECSSPRNSSDFLGFFG